MTQPLFGRRRFLGAGAAFGAGAMGLVGCAHTVGMQDIDSTTPIALVIAATAAPARSTRPGPSPRFPARPRLRARAVCSRSLTNVRDDSRAHP